MSLCGVLPLLERRREFLLACDRLREGRPVWVTGPAGAAKASVLAALATRLGDDAPAWLVLTASREQAERLVDDLAAFLPEGRWGVHFLTPWEILGPEDPPSVEAEGAFYRCLEAARRGDPVIAVAPPGAFLRPAPSPEYLARARVELRPGDSVRLEDVVSRLVASGYERTDLVQHPGQLAVRGGLVDVFPATADAPLRIEWWGDEVESVRLFDPETQRTTAPCAAAVILPARSQDQTASPDGSPLLLDVLASAVCVLDEPDDTARRARDLYEQVASAYRRAGAAEALPFVPWDRLAEALGGRRTLSLSALRRPPGEDCVELPVGTVESFAGRTEALARQVLRWKEAGGRVVVASRQAHRMVELLAEHGVPAGLVERLSAPPPPAAVTAVAQGLSQGFVLDDLVLVTDSEILGWRRRRRALRWSHEGARLQSWTELTPGDLVVHVHHGIGIYRGLERLSIGGGERDYLHIEYAGGDALYVPTDQIALVARYIGVEGQTPQIHRLGGAEWDREKRRVRERAREMARELLELYAARERAKGHAFSPDTPWQHELEQAFPFEETPDQLKAIEEVKRDMESPRPMDRLVCGDVGYGKTEVALRAAFKAVMDGKQVAVLVPTTILAQQHYTVFRERFAPYPVRVELLSRFLGPREQAEVLDGLRTGQVDVVIGTHKLLSPAVRFRDLGLVIIDEEQRFGVRHKERLKQLRTQVDVLTLTATPIPRTLHMSLAGLRDLSVMETPPEARQPIRTFIREEDPALIQEAIRRELGRGGQVYVVHNRVETIERAARKIRRVVPEARVAVAHGQMPEAKLERVMLDFMAGRYDVLVCTTIVEIGLDIPRVNTIIIEDAHLLGLAQLYQLRGRVGRADRQAYAYLLYPAHARLTPEAEQRLLAMREFVELGSGLRLAIRDLEIRGAGNLLGPEQHGHLAAVGLDLYLRLLDQAVRELRGEIVEEPPEITVDLDVAAYLPESYVASPAQRIAFYRKLAEGHTPEECDRVVAELRDRYGPLPDPARRLGEVARLRALARQAGVAAISRTPSGILLRLQDPQGDGEHARAVASELRGWTTWTPEGIVVRAGERSFEEAARVVAHVLERVASGTRRRRVPADAGSRTGGAAEIPAGGHTR
jgi:transcription-repair coupling factor (superfamily II helicase)